MSGDDDALKILHSNRSACYLKVGRNTEALADATRCETIDRNWDKGLTRKGDALMALLRYDEALQIFQGIVNRTNDNGARVKMNQIQRIIDQANANPFTTPQAQAVMHGTPLNFDMNNKLTAIQSIARVLVVICGILYFIPIRSISLISHR